jgi:hypothetical protein
VEYKGTDGRTALFTVEDGKVKVSVKDAVTGKLPETAVVESSFIGGGSAVYFPATNAQKEQGIPFGDILRFDKETTEKIKGNFFPNDRYETQPGGPIPAGSTIKDGVIKYNTPLIMAKDSKAIVEFNMGGKDNVSLPLKQKEGTGELYVVDPTGKIGYVKNDALGTSSIWFEADASQKEGGGLPYNVGKVVNADKMYKQAFPNAFPKGGNPSEYVNNFWGRPNIDVVVPALEPRVAEQPVVAAAPSAALAGSIDEQKAWEKALVGSLGDGVGGSIYYPAAIEAPKNMDKYETQVVDLNKLDEINKEAVTLLKDQKIAEIQAKLGQISDTWVASPEKIPNEKQYKEYTALRNELDRLQAQPDLAAPAVATLPVAPAPLDLDTKAEKLTTVAQPVPLDEESRYLGESDKIMKALQAPPVPPAPELVISPEETKIAKPEATQLPALVVSPDLKSVQDELDRRTSITRESEKEHGVEEVGLEGYGKQDLKSNKASERFMRSKK